MSEYNFHLTEEIARWAFEVRCRETKDWYIAFTNPTAGPWKSVKALSPIGEEGEIHRFASTETRPDIVLINDRLRIILIIEAKDSLAKLVAGDQAEKSARVVSDMSKLFHGMTGDPCWGNRCRYRILTGLLWGAERPSASYVARHAFCIYADELRRLPHIDDTAIIGIETLRESDNSLSCSLKYYLDDCDADGFGTDDFGQGCFGPDFFSPDSPSLGCLTPDYRSPGCFSPDSPSPGCLTPDHRSPGRRSSGITEDQIKIIADSLHLSAIRC